ncbi:MAG: NAD(+)/NADH kinase [Lachnospiraceae bacterium]|nr:NAD(+)/NADH kinase [Lachnospiraceae bacterium]
MKHFYLIANEVKDPEGLYTEKITAYLEKHGGKVTRIDNTDCKGMDEIAGKRHSEENGACALVLGGDGTLLRAARNMIDKDIPLLGINLGTLGYLAEVESGAIEPALNKLLADEYTREERMMLVGRVKKQDREEENIALNDIVISRFGSLQILTLHIYVNGQFLNSFSADGMIVATPTGSTGYNMSAGGPVVEPAANLLLLTPICPHTLNARSIVLAPEDEIRIEIPQGKDGRLQEVEANFDGSHKIKLETGDSIVVRKATKTTGILKVNTESFLTVLHKKMSE